MLLPVLEPILRGDLRGRLAEDDRDLVVRLQRVALRVPGLALAVDVPLEAVAVRTDAASVQEHPPLGDELPQSELVIRLRRLDVDDTARVVRMELGDVLRADVDPDQRRNTDLLAVDEDVEVRVVVGVDGFLRQSRQPQRRQPVGQELVLRGPRRLRLPDSRETVVGGDVRVRLRAAVAVVASEDHPERDGGDHHHSPGNDRGPEPPGTCGDAGGSARLALLRCLDSGRGWSADFCRHARAEAYPSATGDWRKYATCAFFGVPPT